jgi:antitoxin (DNA-binding transcriptional repressor) of toxin-antitoxin stability system
MERLTIRELSRETAAVLDRVERGETIEVERGRRVVAKVVPVQQDEARRAHWAEHFAWFDSFAKPRKRSDKDPVDELIASRRRRETLR